MGNLPRSIPKKVHHALTEGLEVLGNVLMGENSRSDELECVKEEQNRFLQDLIA